MPMRRWRAPRRATISARSAGRGSTPPARSKTRCCGRGRSCPEARPYQSWFDAELGFDGLHVGLKLAGCINIGLPAHPIAIAYLGGTSSIHGLRILGPQLQSVIVIVDGGFKIALV